jgi:uncharacterized protein (DUF433 family)
MISDVTSHLLPDEQRTEHPYVTRTNPSSGSLARVRGTRITVRLIAQM